MSLVKSRHPVQNPEMDTKSKTRKPKLQVVQTGLPHWLLPKRMDPDAPLTDADLNFVLDEMRRGKTVASTLRDNPGLPDRAVLMKYIFSDAKLEEQYFEAKRNAVEVFMDTAQDTIMDTLDSDAPPEDLERSKFKVANLWKLAGVYNRKRYGESKEINIKGQIDMRAAMERGDQRLIETGVTIEHED